MRAFLYYRNTQEHQLDVMRNLAIGMTKHGIVCQVGVDAAAAKGADFTVWWGDKAPDYVCDRPRLILEAGYINGQSGDYVRDRLRFVSAGWNGLHGRAILAPLDCPPDRWQELEVDLAPWSAVGKYVLVCDQHPGDSCSPVSSRWWRSAQQMANFYGLDLRYRPHPLMAGKMRTLSEALKDAAMCVTYSSTAAIEAVLSGVPTVAIDRGSAAWEVCSHSFDDDMYLGPRQQWAYNLAYRQWTWHELANGSAWEHLKYGLAASN